MAQDESTPNDYAAIGAVSKRKPMSAVRTEQAATDEYGRTVDATYEVTLDGDGDHVMVFWDSGSNRRVAVCGNPHDDTTLSGAMNMGSLPEATRQRCKAIEEWAEAHAVDGEGDLGRVWSKQLGE